MGLMAWWESRKEDARQREAELEAERIKILEEYKEHQRVEGYKAKEKYYLETYRDEKWGEGSRIGFSSVEATNVFYRVLAEQGKSGSTLKILASPKDLQALSMEEFSPSPIGVMAAKNFKLSLLFRNAAEQGSPDGQAVLKIAKTWSQKIQGFKENLQVGIMSSYDFYELQKRNIASFSAANVSPNVEEYMHAFKIQRCEVSDDDGGVDEGHQVAEFFSLEKDGCFSGPAVDREFIVLLSRAQPITLENM